MAPERPTDGRIISQALSIKLVFGVGIGLVVGAILPFVFGRVSRPAPAVTELPAWSSNGGSTANTGNTAQTMAPTWLPPAPGSTTSVLPQAASAPAPAILLPQPPQVGDYRPKALSEPPWSPPQSPAAAGPALTPSPLRNNDLHPPMANTYSPDNRADYRGLDRDPRPGVPGAPDPRNVQADRRSDPAAQYRNNDTRYDYRGNPVETAPVRRDVPAGEYPRDTRYENLSGVYPPAAAPGNSSMPSGTPGPNIGLSEPASLGAGRCSVRRYDCHPSCQDEL